MPPIFVDPDWFNRKWYGASQHMQLRPPPILSCAALIGSVMIVFIVLLS